MKGPIRKHMPYFNVLEALRKAEGCAICRMEEVEEKRYFDHVLYECVNDRGVRADLVRSRGYCSEHARVLAGVGDGLGTAILYEDQLKLTVEFLKQLGEGPAPSRNSRRVLEAWERGKEGPCPACHHLERAGLGYVRTLLEGIGEAELMQALDAGPGLCLDHLLTALQCTDDAAAASHLIEVHLRKFSELLREVQEFVRKSDASRGPQEFGREKDAWLRAVGMLGRG